MRISDWSSDVCSSDLRNARRAVRDVSIDPPLGRRGQGQRPVLLSTVPQRLPHLLDPPACGRADCARAATGAGTADRKSVVEGKSVSVRVALGGRSVIKKTTSESTQIKLETQDKLYELNLR